MSRAQVTLAVVSSYVAVGSRATQVRLTPQEIGLRNAPFFSAAMTASTAASNALPS